jgi:(S)-2-hydroxyglutarate dehydrogenase
VSERYDVAVVGAGIIGLASARELLGRRPGLRLLVLDKESEPATHQSGHNSGVLHSGIYYRPRSLKACLCREGKRLLEEYAAQKGIPVVRRGKLVVALTESELPQLEELKRRGEANGVPGLRELGREEIRELEPHSAGIRALYSPETAVVDFRKVAAAFADDVRGAGGTVRLGAEVRDITERTGRRELDTTAGTFEAGALVSCAGLQGDRVAAMTGLRSETRLVPFRGDYYTLAPGARSLVNGLVYPVPDLTFPFLGVHFTKTVDGEVLAGPNAVLALAREGYRRRDVVLRDTLDTFRYPGFWRLARRHYRTGLGEVWRDFVKGAFAREMRRYLPSLGDGDVRFGPSGVRAQFLARDGMLVDDFLVEEGPGVLHILNAPSPGATSSLAIGRLVADRAERLFSP